MTHLPILNEELFRTPESSKSQGRNDVFSVLVFAKKVWMFRAFFCEKRITFPIYKVSRLGEVWGKILKFVLVDVGWSIL